MDQPELNEEELPHAEPQDLIEPDDALPEITLAELPESLRLAAAKAKWTKLMPVQAKAIPYMLAVAHGQWQNWRVPLADPHPH